MTLSLPEPFRPKALCLDLETSRHDAFKLYQLAAWRADTGAQVCADKKIDFALLQAPLDRLAEGAAFLLGHNVRRHDLPVLKMLCPGLKLHDLRLIDTLELSPLAFPANPYHRLVKDYKLLRDSRNDPLKDAKLALSLWGDQNQAMQAWQQSDPERVAVYHALLADEAGLDTFFTSVRGAFAPSSERLAASLAGQLQGKVCPQQLGGLIPLLQADAAARMAFAYTFAWLGVCSGNSVLPPWVRQTYPSVLAQIRQLRETHCGRDDCPYCSEHLDIRRELKRYFGFDGFRPQPATPDGGSLQEAIVRAGYDGQSLLAILPTGGGKSMCYQLPALSRYWRNSSLTIVISPLQSLMKDQVDNLVKIGVLSAAMLNGMLSMPERREVLEKIRLGDVSILLVSPEQFRSQAFANAIRQRQIGGWVFDEAHCLSRWGHDFRTDYLYVTRFIREHHAAPLAPVFAFTATAKQDVIDDLQSHFRDMLGVELQLHNGGVERANLQYDVIHIEQGSKRQEMQNLLRHDLADGGAAVVFVSRRKATEEYAEFLTQQGWRCAAFHAGLDPAGKKMLQQQFMAGELQIIVATNAFGMGVDKPDIRLVIHADIPGSLENYLQEAGRAGRDQDAARCVLLFCTEDVDTQFGLATRSRLSRQDIAAILRMLKRQSAKSGGEELVLTSREILRLDPEVETGIDDEAADADTKVRTALHWLEQAQLLARNENRTQVFPGSLKTGSLDEAASVLKKADLPPEKYQRYEQLLAYLINLDEDEAVSTDDITLHLGIPVEECMLLLRGLDKLGLLNNDMKIVCLLRRGVVDTSAERLQRLIQLENALIRLMREQAPDAGADEWQEMGLRHICQQLRDECGFEVLGDTLLPLLRSLARPLPMQDGSSKHEFLQIRIMRREVLRVRVLKPWSLLEKLAARRQLLASLLLDHLLKSLAEGARGATLAVSVGMGELGDVLAQDITLAAEWRGDVEREMAGVNAGLMFLHENGVLVLDKGKAIFRAAMTIHLQPESKGRGFRDSDFSSLRAHYQDRTLQIHVMHEYARLGLAKMADAMAFVLAYFSLPKLEFIRRYFAHRKEELERAATEEAYRAIVTDLGNPAQARLVCAPEQGNRLILAGPGSGKTRVIVHRVAYLVRIKGELPERILVLAYNRAAAVEIRQRLLALLGPAAYGVTVLTYHALALRLTGRSLAGMADKGGETLFQDLLADAIALLAGRHQVPGSDDGDELRERLLGGYRYILVDEYQDIDEQQYELIAALAGRTREQDAQLTLMAVGDDDQNIYAFRDTDNRFIRQFQQDYQAEMAFLVENYRSGQHIIAAANTLIAANPERMKTAHPVRIDHARHKQPAGGRWTALDPVAGGKVLILQSGDADMAQLQAVVAEIGRRRQLEPQLGWQHIAILARNNRALEPFVAWCESEGIPYQRRGDAEKSQPFLHQVREGRALLQQLAYTARPLSLAVAWQQAIAQSEAAPDNDWLALCAQFWQEQCEQWGEEESLPGATLLDAFYEFSRDARRDKPTALTLSTVHQAKGGQWQQVFVLDGGEWFRQDAAERRLFYVAMTRAAEGLILCHREGGRHAFLPSLTRQENVVSLSVGRPAAVSASWHWQYCRIGLDGVFLSYAGRYAPDHPLHAALAALQYGQLLTLREQDGKRQIVNAEGLVLITLAKQASLPPGKRLAVRLESLVWRMAVQNDPRYPAHPALDGWWVPLFSVVIAPDAPTGQDLRPTLLR